ncbi:MAG: hypothetical protein ACUVTL_09710 [Thermoproteota archaeon]
MGEESPIEVELNNLQTCKTYSFYKVFHKVERPFIDIQSEKIRSFQVDQEVIVKIRAIPIWEFINSIEGNESWKVKLNKKGILTANLGKKRFLSNHLTMTT